MKKSTIAAIAMIVAVLGTSCTKLQTKAADPGKAMLTLNMELNTNEANDTLSNGNPSPTKKWENNFPSGFMVQFIIDSKDLQENPIAGYTYDKLVYNGTYANGKVTVELPAISIPHNVEVKFPDLELTRTYRLGATGSPSYPERDTTVTRVYTKGMETYSIWNGAMLVKDHVMYDL